jgi:hypothetical protein
MSTRKQAAAGWLLLLLADRLKSRDMPLKPTGRAFLAVVLPDVYVLLSRSDLRECQLVQICLRVESNEPDCLYFWLPLGVTLRLNHLSLLPIAGLPSRDMTTYLSVPAWNGSSGLIKCLC